MLAGPTRLLLASLALATSSATAQTAATPESSPPLRVVVRTSTSAEHRLLERLQGQTSDLNVTLIAADEPWPSTQPLGDQLVLAANLAQNYGARGVVWLQIQAPWRGTASRALMWVDHPQGSRVLVRSLETGEIEPRDTPTSSQLEVAALAVRSTLRAMQQGQTVGVTPEQAVAAEPPAEPDSEPAPSDPRPIPNAPSETEGAWTVKPRGPSGLRVVFELGWQAVLDGEASYGHQGPLARIGLRWRRWELGVRGHLSLPTRHRREGLQLDLVRRTAGVYAGYVVSLSKRFSVLPTLGAARVAWTHSPRADDRFSLRAGTTDWFTAVHADASLRWALSETLHLALGLGAEVLPEAPRFGYVAQSANVRLLRPWHIQPTGALMLGMTLP